jgi:hypothetical protein
MFRHSCRFVEVVLGITVIVFAFLPEFFYSKWVLVASGILLLLHSATCNVCGISIPDDLLASKRRR